LTRLDSFILLEVVVAVVVDMHFEKVKRTSAV